MARWLFLPDSTIKDLIAISKLSSAAIVDLKQYLDSTDPDDAYSNFVQIAELLKISDQDAASLYTFWGYIQKEKKANARDSAAVIADFTAFLKVKAEAQPEKAKELAQCVERIGEKRSELEILFGDFPGRDRLKKAHSLESGPLPHISNFKAYCDLRPVYDQAGVSILDFLPIITLRVAIHDSLDEHKEFFVQLSESNIEMVETEFLRLKAKLKSLKTKSLAAFKASKRGKDGGGA